MEILEEIWKDIEGYEGLYQVSNLGNVKSLGNCKSRKEKILKPNKTKKCYLQVQLYKDGRMKSFKVHRLVAQVFISNPLNLPQINHRDENKENNVATNLEYCTAKENSNYGTRNERVTKANINGKCSKKVLQFSLENEFIREWQSTREVERQMGFNNSHICKCCNGKMKQAYNFIWKYA